MKRLIAAIALLSSPVFAQNDVITTEILQKQLDTVDDNTVVAHRQTATSVMMGELRVLDKITGEVVDLSLMAGQDTTVGHLTVYLGDCRYPTDNPSGDAFAQLSITDKNQQIPVFEGWMIASSPALSAMEHPRYDVWVLRCMIS